MTVRRGSRSGSGTVAGGSPETADPALALLRGGAVPALAVGVALAGGLSFVGARAAIGAALGAVLVCVAMSAGPLVMKAARQWSPPAVMAVSLLTYGVVVMMLGVAYLALERVAWLSPLHLGIALIACGTAWAAGEVQAVRRLRVLAFGDEAPVAEGPPTAEGGGA